ncbi:uncharacterized protein V6R79_017157 [Siganus canaliculatus]
MKKQNRRRITLMKKQQSVTHFDETEQIVLRSFWTRFIKEEITMLAADAESSMDKVETANHQQMIRRQCELMNRNLEQEVYELKRGLNEWIDLIPRAKVTESRDHNRKLRKP